MRIDAHQHFWVYSPEAHAWIDDSMAALRRDYLPGEFEGLLRLAAFDAGIVVQAAQTMEETRWLLALADAHPFLFGVVGWVDLRAPDVETQLESLAPHPKLCGVRHDVQREPDDRFLLQPEFQRGIGVLRKFRLVYDLLIVPRQLPAAVELVRRFPDQPFVLDHLGKPEIRDRRLEPWASQIRDLAKCPNVAAKLSGLVTEADRRDWKPEDLGPYVDVAFEAFGPRRLMVGSDWPVCTLAADHGTVLRLVEDRLGSLSSEDAAEVLGGTAQRVYLARGASAAGGPPPKASP